MTSSIRKATTLHFTHIMLFDITGHIYHVVSTLQKKIYETPGDPVNNNARISEKIQ